MMITKSIINLTMNKKKRTNRLDREDEDKMEDNKNGKVTIT